MHLLDQRIIGIAILFLLGSLVIVKRFAAGSVFDKPQGNLLVQIVNIFNLFFLLIVNPAAAVLLITRFFESFDPTRLSVNDPLTLMILEIIGFAIYISGYILMAWALIILRRNYQLGGCAPRSEDKMIIDGPYKLIRHPMYTAAISISLGLAFLVQSLLFLSIFFIYLILIAPLINVEENELRRAYGTAYVAYQQKVKKLIPFIY